MTVLRVVDIETTGMTPPEAEVIELGMQDVACQPCGAEARLLGQVRSWLYRPARPCPPEVMAVHHILPEQLEDQGSWSAVGAEHHMSDLCGRPEYYVAHNAEYEQRFLAEFAFPWICTYKVALVLWPDAPSHGNQALMYWLGLHRDMEDYLRHPPHRAGPDAYVTAHILAYALRFMNPEQMVQVSREHRRLPTCPIGKFRGRRWAEVDHGFLSWMLRQPDMEEDLKWNAQRELERRRTASLRGD